MNEGRLLQEQLTRAVIGAFYEVYNNLGYGFLEHVYVAALERELRARGHAVARERKVRVTYKGEDLGFQCLDMIVDDVLIVEAKSTFALERNASRQLYNYLRATNLEIGLLLHFGPRPTFKRVIHEARLKHPEPSSVSSTPVL